MLGLLALTVLSVIAENLLVEFSDRVTMTAANLPIVLAVMFLGWLAVMTVAAVAGAWGCWRERSVFIALFNEANYLLAAFSQLPCLLACQSTWGFGLSTRSRLSCLWQGCLAATAYEA